MEERIDINKVDAASVTQDVRPPSWSGHRSGTGGDAGALCSLFLCKSADYWDQGSGDYISQVRLNISIGFNL